MALPARNGATHILVVEDDLDIALLIRHAFEREGQARVELAANGRAALQAVDTNPPDIVILDLNLPDVDGFEVCRRIRARSEGRGIPIIAVTARLSEADRVRALDLGVDDYVTKPFGLKELAARVRAVLRRSSRHEATEGIYDGKRLRARFPGVAVTVDGRPVSLTRRELKLLECLVSSRNRVLSRSQLIDHVWPGCDPVGSRTVDVHVGRLRSKLGAAGHQIETVFGVGYRFVED